MIGCQCRSEDRSSAGRVIQPQLLFMQFPSIDHVLQKWQCVDKSIYVGASPLQYMDDRLIMTTAIGQHMLIQNSLNLRLSSTNDKKVIVQMAITLVI